MIHFRFKNPLGLETYDWYICNVISILCHFLIKINELKLFVGLHLQPLILTLTC